MADVRVRRDRVARVLHRDLLPAVYGETCALHLSVRHLPGEPVPYAEAVAGEFVDCPIGTAWGPAWGTAWFRVSGAVPTGWRGEQVVARVDLGWWGQPGFGAEALVFEHGLARQGLSALRTDYPVAAGAGEPVELYVEAAANPSPPPAAFAANDWPLLGPEPDGPPRLRVVLAELAVRRRDVHALAHDVRVLLELYDELPGDGPRAAEVLRALEAACRRLALDDVPGTATAARAPLQEALSRSSALRHTVTAVGHAHLDTAWLWPVRETRRKAARTFANALRLMEDHPQFRFVASQAQHYAWVQEDHPELFDRLRGQVAAGRFEPVGGMWVEADCNLPSGESLVRQLVHGKRYFREQLGYEPREVWLPDVFGYPATLPQVVREAGSEYFLTQKLSWNDTNRFPHHTFWWEGLDGSRVLTHFPPADTYNGDMSVREVLGSVRRFRQHGQVERSLYPFGYGDGGGGPTADMLESAARLRDVDGVPPVRLGRALDFFTDLAAEAQAAADGGAALPTWVGELYLEYHRGTFTSQARLKRSNRRLEVLLAAAELWSAVAPVDYPHAALDRAWKLLLLHQFHDVIPGSGIRWAYDDAERDHAEVERVAAGARDAALEAVAAQVDTSWAAAPVVVFNQSSFDRREVLTAETPDGEPVTFVATVPSCGYATHDLRAGPAADAAVAVRGPVLENDLLRVEWDATGLLTSVLDKEADREVVPTGARANVLQLFDDYPTSFDAWDIDESYRERCVELTALDATEVVAAGPLRAGVRFTRSFGASRIAQTLWLDAGSRLLVFDTEVDWHESHRLLKAAFPLAVRALRATYDVQFGHVERPTHRNTSWDEARFEVCAHKWADLSEPGYGVALLNDGRYGHDAAPGLLRLSLLRAPGAPDPTADRGRHVVRYGLLPHAGDLREAGVVEAAISFNAPLVVHPTGRHPGPRPAARSFLSFDRPGAVVEAVKRADDGSGLVVRVVEAYGGHRDVRLRLPVDGTVTRTDLLERDLEPLRADADGVSLSLPPFALRTVTVR